MDTTQFVTILIVPVCCQAMLTSKCCILNIWLFISFLYYICFGSMHGFLDILPSRSFCQILHALPHLLYSPARDLSLPSMSWPQILSIGDFDRPAYLLVLQVDPQWCMKPLDLSKSFIRSPRSSIPLHDGFLSPTMSAAVDSKLLERLNDFHRAVSWLESSRSTDLSSP